MPKLADRDSFEQELAAILTKVNARQRRAIEASMGEPPQVTAETRRLVEQAAKELREDDEAAALLILLFIAGIDSMRRQTRLDYDEELAARQAQQYASTRLTEVADSMATTTLDRLETATRSGALEERLDAIFGKERMEGAGVSETTNANTEGERTFRDGVDTGNMELVAYWRHSGRRPPGHSNAPIRPCSICSPLEGTSEWEWARINPAIVNGPPAHPHCDCFLEWRLLPREEVERLRGR